MRFYTISGDWSRMEDATGLWLDPAQPYADATQADLDNGTGRFGKSIYDPCPPGWHVPIDGTWNDFRHGVTAHNAARGLGFANGLRYWPNMQEGTEYPVNGTIFYPAAGFRVARNGTVDSRSYGASASVTLLGGTISNYHLLFDAVSVSPNLADVHAYGISTRCVRQ
jgi:hypothetical protein